MKIHFRYLLIVWVVIMLIATSIPDLKLPTQRFTWRDKFLHAGEYFICALLFLFTLQQEGRLNKKWQRILVVMASCMILGVLDEWHQTLIPGREADVADLLADLAGIGFALIGFIIIARQREKKKENILTIRQRQERE
jgi:VanZ family protein